MRRDELTITTCPSCGSSAIRRIRKDWKGQWQGKSYTVKALQYYVCPTCQEKVYPPEAMQKIQQASPAFSRPGTEPQPAEESLRPGSRLATR